MILGLTRCWLRGSRYSDREFEYRHVSLPKGMLNAMPDRFRDKKNGTLKLLWEDEWRSLGITQVRRQTPDYTIGTHAFLPCD